MRVLFTCYPERTHFLLMAPLAWALRAAGHEVRVAAQPKLTETVTGAGLTAVPVGSDRDLWQVLGRIRDEAAPLVPGLPEPYDAVERDEADITLEYLRAGYAHHIGNWAKMINVPLVPGLVDFARSWRPDLVIWEPLTHAGAIAARAVGAAHARLLIGADVHGIARQHFRRLGGHLGADPLAEWLGGYARKYGFAFDESLVTGDFSLDVLPPPLQVHAPGLDYRSMRYVPYGGAAVVPKWLREPPVRPRVALTLGLTVSDHGIGYPVGVREILDAVADLDIELVATIGEAGRAALGTIPDNTRLVSYVPLQDLLPTCSAIIHHAGVGTLMTAALYGVPQLTLPWDVDQPLLSGRLAAHGAGLTTHATRATGEQVRRQLQQLLHEEVFRERAAQLRCESEAVESPGGLVADLVDRVSAICAENAP
ncbi:activator-dependent family glycosyltransferase [Streptomyces sp. L06]|nr:activator-dependent family glycosyltransferase [Streptomyces sp. L06]